MNRPKFRVWDKEEQKWYKPTYKAYMNELHDIHIDLDGRLLIRTIDESGKRVTIHESMFEGRYELLQSTGLFDKNGKEIFEGDIVKHDSVPNPFISNAYYEIIQVRSGLWRMDNYRGSQVLAFSNQEVEVIGNKFEHPHLLGEDE